MTITAGAKLGPYSVTRELGHGGMGVVYLASDTRLGREVAIKALPEHLASDPDRLARFEREARMLAQLSHPNVAGIYGVEEHAGARYLVLEYVEGETLAQRLDRGPMAADEAIEYAAQIAAGVEAAHEAGVIHRDLKPGNIIVTPEGKAKVLDFGLARSAQRRGGSTSDLPTISRLAPVTEAGAALGTPAYMSPEQARGRPLDRRTDIWSFACVLYEMLTGKRAFPEAAGADLTAAILNREPDLTLVARAPAPQQVVRLLRRCLVKDPEHRLRDIGDARIELDEARSPGRGDPEPGSAPPAGAARARRWILAACAVAISGAAIVIATMFRTDDSPPVPVPAHVSIVMPYPPIRNSYFLPTFSCSRDGRSLVFLSQGADGVARLVLRTLDDPEPRVLVETRGGLETAAFSPDGAWIVYSEEGEVIRRVSIEGGPTELVCRRSRVPGIVWTRDGRLIFASADDGLLHEVSASGGEPRVLDIPLAQDAAARWPHLIRDDGVLLYSCVDRRGTDPRRWIEAYDFQTGRTKSLIDNASYPRTAFGHLLFQRDATLMAAPFDADTLELTGPARPVLETTSMPFVGAGPWSVADNGTLFVLAKRPVPQSELVRVALDGSAQTLSRQRPFLHHLIQEMRLSPDAEKVAGVLLVETMLGRIFVHDLARDLIMALPSEGGSHARPVWSSDGRWIYYSQYQLGTVGWEGLYRRRADGTGDPELLFSGSPAVHTEDITADGGRMLVTVTDAHYSILDPGDLGIVDLTQAEPSVRLLTQTPFNEHDARFSPDGRWIAYVSTESGVPQVYLRPTDTPTGRVQVSIDGGSGPVWSPDGARIYFGDRDARMIMVASVSFPADDASAPPAVSAPRELVPMLSDRPVEDVFPTGEHLLMISDVSDASGQSTTIDVILGFSGMLQDGGG